jgi:hypothetical protein
MVAAGMSWITDTLIIKLKLDHCCSQIRPRAAYPVERHGEAGQEGETEMTYDVYQGTTDSGLRMATRPGAEPPNHVEPEDWELMPAGTSQLIDVDIADRGFCFFRLVSK